MNTPSKFTSRDGAPTETAAVRKPYVAPVFRIHGDFAALTQASGKGIADGLTGLSMIF